MGTALLDCDDPAKLIALLREPGAGCGSADRSDDLPNVVYTCAALPVGERLLLPYEVRDNTAHFAFTIDDMLSLID